MPQFEREKMTTCTGVVGQYDNDQHRYIRKPATDFVPTQQVFIRLQEVDGVVGIDCPFYGPDRRCLQSERVWRSKPRPLEFVMPEVCKFAPQAHWSEEMAEPAFEEPHYFQMVLDRLSPKARSAAFEMNKYCFEGMGKDHFDSMCYVFNWAKTREDSQKIVDELCEMGLVAERSRLEALHEALAQIEDGTYEDMDLVNGGKEIVNRRKESIEGEIHEYLNPAPRRFNEYWSYVDLDDPAAVKRAEDFIKEETEGWNTPETHLRFVPGFQRFLNQFYSLDNPPIG